MTREQAIEAALDGIRRVLESGATISRWDATKPVLELVPVGDTYEYRGNLKIDMAQAPATQHDWSGIWTGPTTAEWDNNTVVP